MSSSIIDEEKHYELPESEIEDGYRRAMVDIRKSTMVAETLGDYEEAKKDAILVQTQPNFFVQPGEHTDGISPNVDSNSQPQTLAPLPNLEDSDDELDANVNLHASVLQLDRFTPLFEDTANEEDHRSQETVILCGVGDHPIVAPLGMEPGSGFSIPRMINVTDWGDLEILKAMGATPKTFGTMSTGMEILGRQNKDLLVRVESLNEDAVKHLNMLHEQGCLIGTLISLMRQKQLMVYGQAFTEFDGDVRRVRAMALLATERDRLEAQCSYLKLQDKINRQTAKTLILTERPGASEKKEKLIKRLDIDEYPDVDLQCIRKISKIEQMDEEAMSVFLKSYTEMIDARKAEQKIKNAEANNLFVSMAEMIYQHHGPRVLNSLVRSKLGELAKWAPFPDDEPRMRGSKAAIIGVSFDFIKEIEHQREEEKIRSHLGTGYDLSVALTMEKILTICGDESKDDMKLMSVRYTNLILEKVKELGIANIELLSNCDLLAAKLRDSEARGDRLEYLSLPSERDMERFAKIFPRLERQLRQDKSGAEIWNTLQLGIDRLRCDIKSEDLGELSAELGADLRDVHALEITQLNNDHRAEQAKFEKKKQSLELQLNFRNAENENFKAQIKTLQDRTHEDFVCPIANLLVKRDREIGDKGRELTYANQAAHDQQQKLKSEISFLSDHLAAKDREIEKLRKEPERVREEWSDKVQRRNAKVTTAEAGLETEKQAHNVTKLDYEALNNKFEKLEKDFEKKTKKLGEFEKRYDDEYAKVKAQRDKLTTENEQFRASNSEKEQQLLVRIAEIEKSQELRAHSGPVNAANSQAQNDNRILEENEKLRNKKEELQTNISEHISLNENLQEMLTTVKFENTLLRIGIASLEQDMEQSNKQYPSLDATPEAAPAHATHEWLVDYDLVRDLLREQNRLKSELSSSEQKQNSLLRDLAKEKNKLKQVGERLGSLVDIALETGVLVSGSGAD